MLHPFIDPGQPELDDRFPVARDRPFTYQDARQHGLSSEELASLCADGYLRRLVSGVYVANTVPDSLELRVAGLRLVVPSDAVVTDRTAGWLHGAQTVLAPGDHLEVPRVSMYVDRRGGRLRNDLADSGQRFMRVDDVVDVQGLLVTSPLRTACDLGRLLHRDRAFAALDSMLSLGEFTREELVVAVERHKGMRGVRQLRMLAPLADPRAESPPESILRLRALDLGLATIEPQVEVVVGSGRSFWIDLAIERLLLGFEYDGEEWHDRTETQHAHDRDRRAQLAGVGWLIEPVTRHHLFGPRSDIDQLLLLAVRRARQRLRRR